MNSRCLSRVGILLLLASGTALGQTAGPEPLTLRKAAELALERAPDLAAARAASEVGRSSANLARDIFHPNAWITTTPGYTHGLPGVVAGRVPSVIGVEVRQLIYDKDRKADALSAEAEASSIDAELGQACRATLERVVTVYARAFMDEGVIAAAQRRLDAAEAIARREAALLAEGRVTELDAERSRLQAARARQKVLNAESDRDLDMLELKRLIGWPGSSPLRLAGDPDAILPELTATENLAAAKAADPVLTSLTREIQLLGQSARIESKRWMPILEASATYQRLGKFNNYDQYYLTFTPDSVAIGVSILFPLWTGGRFEDGRDRARARLERAEAQLQSRENEVELAVRRAESMVARSLAEKSLSLRSRGLATQDRDALEQLAREGRSDLSDVDEREMALADADTEAAQSNLSSLLERVRLLSLRGELATALLGAEPPCAVAFTK
jgi:outer membrane protein TolC